MTANQTFCLLVVLILAVTACVEAWAQSRRGGDDS